jgi:hypothetical protein
MRGRADYKASADLGREDAANLVEDARQFLEVVGERVFSPR